MMMVAIFFADGFEEIEAVTVYDILKRADVETISVGVGSKNIEGSHGLRVTTDIEISEIDAKTLEMAVLPGGMPGTKNLGDSKKLKEILAKLCVEKKRIAAICAAPSILGSLGLLEDHEAVCYPGFEKYLKGAVLSRKCVITDENITTSKGPGTAVDFGLELVRILKGEKKRNELARSMQYRERHDGY
jgi:protein deglycase